MTLSHRLAAAVAAACLGIAATQSSAGETAITIYSAAQPGGIPAEYYRPLPGQGTAGREQTKAGQAQAALDEVTARESSAAHAASIGPPPRARRDLRHSGAYAP